MTSRLPASDSKILISASKKWLLHNTAAPMSKADADLCKNVLFEEEIHFYQVPWEYAHWEETKLFPSWEQLISSQYFQTWDQISAAEHQPLQPLSHPGCAGTPLHTFKEKQQLKITALRAENNERLQKYRFCILVLCFDGGQ